MLGSSFMVNSHGHCSKRKRVNQNEQRRQVVKSGRIASRFFVAGPNVDTGIIGKTPDFVFKIIYNIHANQLQYG